MCHNNKTWRLIYTRYYFDIVYYDYEKKSLYRVECLCYVQVNVIERILLAFYAKEVRYFTIHALGVFQL